ncbi:prostaglandin E receptor 4 (subtype EP4) a [Tachysurus fulvidraco]|uniref:prostaglandin E receptor 4 (subtype EP4) a n=1 Tax=Tachysurus fulvidraco TaxID=1234273 RepID=UPI000F4E86A6|nr:prostaglandin E receptor 4 (subtype EP4) a [Tachysurus fulvidraco]
MYNSTVSLLRMEPTVPVVMFIFGVVSNLIAIVVLCKSRKEQKETIFYTLVCGLAVTDLLGTVLASPVTIVTYVKGSWPTGEPLCQYFGFVLLFFSLAGLSIICAMSVERYVAINHAYFYNDYVNQRLASATLLAIYVSNGVFCALPSVGFGRVTKQYPETWCFLDWRTEENIHAAFSYMYAGVSVVLILATVICNVAVCCALMRMHRRFVRRMSLGSDQWRATEVGRKRSCRRLAGAEIHMVVLLIATSAVVLVCSIPLVVQVFINQIYKIPVEKRLDKNPDLLAIRFASINPILDPWIYILLRKAVFIKLTKNINYLFCKIIARGQQKQANFHWLEQRRMSSIISKDSISLVSRNLRDVRSTSQTFLCLSTITEPYKDTCSSSHIGSSPYSSQQLGIEFSNKNSSENEGEKCTINHTCHPSCFKEPDTN